MNASLTKTTVLCIALALLGAVGASGATSSGAKTPPTCLLGQKNTTAKHCTANPAFGIATCKSLVPLLQPLAPGVTLVGSNKNTGAPIGIDCWFQANGQRQAFDVQVSGGANAKTSYAQGLQQYTGYANDATLSCSTGAAQAPVQTVSGLGDKAFAWASCPPQSTGFLVAAAIRSSTYAYVLADPTLVNPTLGQIEGVVRRLLAKYR